MIIDNAAPCECPRRRSRPGITLTEILIAILILGVGLVSLATLFPIGLLRLRDAARYSRSSYLVQSAAADTISRSLLSNNSFSVVDVFNYNGSSGNWLFYSSNPSGSYNPFNQDTPAYGHDYATDTTLGAGANAGWGGPGLPFAYDPLWRYQTVNPNDTQANGPASIQPQGGYYPNDPSGGFEARFGSGIGFIRNDSSGGGSTLPSAHGLPRLTNFTRPFLASGNPLMPQASVIPNIFVSPEDVVWQEATNQQYTLAGNSSIPSGSFPPALGSAPSPVVPDLSITLDSSQNHTYQTISDWRYSWMFTGQLSNAQNQSCFDGNIVIFENRPFGISAPSTIPNPPAAPFQAYQVDGEVCVEAIWGHSGNLNANGYATGADRTVLLRWYATEADPVVKAGDWIADVTYERQQSVVNARWWQGYTNASGKPSPLGVTNPSNNQEWDNLPAQRCLWYQVQKVSPAAPDPYLDATVYRSMVVYVNQSLQSKTVLTAPGVPSVINAALIAPSVVNVIPQTFFTR